MLDRIVAQKRFEMKQLKGSQAARRLKEAALAKENPCREFAGALVRTDEIAVIAEVKFASPSAGVIRDDLPAEEVARQYEANGAAAISVLTDQTFFKGDPAYLQAVHQAVKLPVLRKDFIVSSYQVYEARVLGADAILLIVAALALSELEEYFGLAQELGMDCLVEVHHEDELQQALSCGAALVGINNRDLRTLKTDLTVTERLARYVPDNVTLVSESGIKSAEDLEILHTFGVDAVLVGEALMRGAQPGECLAKLLSRGVDGGIR